MIDMTINGLLENLFRRHSKELLHFATQRAGNVAEDVVQESFLRLIQHPEPHAIENHRAYLFKVTSNVLVDYNRKLEVLAKHHEVCEDFDSLPSTKPGPEIALHHQQLLQQTLRALDDLPAIQSSIFLLHRFDGLSYPQIAKLLKISRATVERHFAVAMEHCFAVALQNAKQPPQSR